jgi:hypothetical protein
MEYPRFKKCLETKAKKSTMFSSRKLTNDEINDILNSINPNNRSSEVTKARTAFPKTDCYDSLESDIIDWEIDQRQKNRAEKERIRIAKQVAAKKAKQEQLAKMMNAYHNKNNALLQEIKVLEAQAKKWEKYTPNNCFREISHNYKNCLTRLIDIGKQNSKNYY